MLLQKLFKGTISLFPSRTYLLPMVGRYQLYEICINFFFTLMVTLLKHVNINNLVRTVKLWCKNWIKAPWCFNIKICFTCRHISRLSKLNGLNLSSCLMDNKKWLVSFQNQNVKTLFVSWIILIMWKYFKHTSVIAKILIKNIIFISWNLVFVS